MNVDQIENLCRKRGLKMTAQRRVIAQVFGRSDDHPDVGQLHQRAVKINPRISIATVYRTVRLFEKAHILARRDFGDGRARYEKTTAHHHDHLIDVENGKVLEFSNEEIEKLQREVAAQMGYRLVNHRLDLYAVPLKSG